ncbi:glycine betaine/L-proline ABC transporter permease/glycine betaine/L-proline-binding protein [Fictibacillus macauensis ZFHKF-1]|uniref:Glycine betaine/L-proline ABC transporter permease/glycine betaine/L-proline-binding protein n=1 Tax=Fictibacillus macauensis ZFHKF-1 TaxID=1196324 RepID=I8UG03_9BACL|nr:glycine betaine ABC transporter substrate-binding protein [Fictibacillus macauensis]EIT85830.1 glycine betaine/L-proline ABC transporter permease/glycine betaine/L-proline-binding protein [Fictibacillus macauensis ZFHKF-1]
MSELMNTFIERWSDIWEALQQHLFLSIVSIVIATVISVPLGIFIARKKKLAEPIIGITSLFQTIPSLALFGFLLPLFGIGNTTAIIALTIYALLPILRNTYTGIIGVDQSAVEAGRGMGMTKNQILRMIELPLAMPTIMAGLRTATVLTIGVVTLAAFIGAGGLGDLIYRGLASTRNELVLAGAIPAAVLALLFDFILKRIEIATNPIGRKGKKPFSWKKASVVVVPVAALVVFFSLRGGASEDAIVISGKKWTEQYILPYVVAEYVKEKTNYDVKVKDGIGDTPILTQALKRGDIDLYLEYTGTAYLDILHQDYKPGTSAEQIFKTDEKMYHDKYKLAWLKPLGFQNMYALAVTKDTYEKLGIKTVSDLQAKSSQVTFGAPTDFYERPEGMKGLMKAYPDLSFKDKKSLDANLMYSAVKDEKVDMITAFTTDGRIKRYNLKMLKDDKKAFPAYYAAPVVREDTLKKYPKLRKTINELAGKINEEEMTQMNTEVDINKKEPKEVAREFLRKKGLIK